MDGRVYPMAKVLDVAENRTRATLAFRIERPSPHQRERDSFSVRDRDRRRRRRRRRPRKGGISGKTDNFATRVGSWIIRISSTSAGRAEPRRFYEI